MSKFLDQNGLIYLWSKVKALAGTKVDKVEGKGLSTNDFTDEDKTKLAALSSGGGVADSVAWDNITDKPDLALKSDISNIYKYKGSVENYASLPTEDNAVGDVWDVTSTGMNYAWTGEGWDALGEMFEIEAITNTEIDSITDAEG